MAIVEMDPMLGTVTGKFANGVFRTMNNKTILVSRPFKGRKKKSSPAQLKHRERFVLALKEAHKIWLDKGKRAEYEAKCPPGTNTFNLIFSETMKKSSEK
jgi:hypothetical protein